MVPVVLPEGCPLGGSGLTPAASSGLERASYGSASLCFLLSFLPTLLGLHLSSGSMLGLLPPILFSYAVSQLLGSPLCSSLPAGQVLGFLLSLLPLFFGQPLSNGSVGHVQLLLMASELRALGAIIRG